MSGEPALSRGTKYVFDEAQDEPVGGFRLPCHNDDNEVSRWDMDPTVCTEGEGTNMGASIVDEFSKKTSTGLGFEGMAIDLPLI